MPIDAYTAALHPQEAARHPESAAFWHHQNSHESYQRLLGTFVK
jgi:hypothetical protein